MPKFMIKVTRRKEPGDSSRKAAQEGARPFKS